MTDSLTAACALFALALAVAERAHAGDPLDCLAPGADCTLAELASQAGVFVGAADDAIRRDEVLADALVREFNSMTSENELKWGFLTSAPGEYDFVPGDFAVDFAEANGLRMRGHTLIWGRLNGPPDWLEGELDAAEDRAARLRELMGEHIATVVGRYAGHIEQWTS